MGGGHYSAYRNCVFQSVFWGTPVESDGVRKRFHGETYLGNAAYHHLVLELFTREFYGEETRPTNWKIQHIFSFFLKETDNMQAFHRVLCPWTAMGPSGF